MSQFCVNCENFECGPPPTMEAHCNRSRTKVLDLVKGKVVSAGPVLDCYRERSSTRGGCGVEARFFEKRR